MEYGYISARYPHPLPTRGEAEEAYHIQARHAGLSDESIEAAIAAGAVQRVGVVRGVFDAPRTSLLQRVLDALQDALQQLEDDEGNARFAAACREFASQRYGTWRDCTRRYQEIYETLLQ